MSSGRERGVEWGRWRERRVVVGEVVEGGEEGERR